MILGLFWIWKFVEIVVWLFFCVIIMGRNDFFVRVMEYDFCIIVLKLSILGYILSGEMVLEVMMIELNWLNIGLMVMVVFRQVKWSIGLGILVVFDLQGFRIRRKFFLQVVIRVVKVVIFCRGWQFLILVSFSVFIRDVSCLVQNWSGFFLIKVYFFRWVRKEGGVFEMICWIFMWVLRYLMNFFRNVIKCLVCLMLFGIVFLRRFFGRVKVKISIFVFDGFL